MSDPVLRVTFTEVSTGKALIDPIEIRLPIELKLGLAVACFKDVLHKRGGAGAVKALQALGFK